MIDHGADLSLTRQADLLQLSRSSLYYVPVEISPADLELMRRIDHLHTDYPFMGARMLRDRLTALGYCIGRRHVARLMRLMGIEALYRKKRTTKRNPGTPGLSVSAARPHDRPAESSLGCGYFLHPDAARFFVLIRHSGLGDEARFGLAPFKHVDHRFLHRNGARGDY